MDYPAHAPIYLDTTCRGTATFSTRWMGILHVEGHRSTGGRHQGNAIVTSKSIGRRSRTNVSCVVTVVVPVGLSFAIWTYFAGPKAEQEKNRLPQTVPSDRHARFY